MKVNKDHLKKAVVVLTTELIVAALRKIRYEFKHCGQKTGSLELALEHLTPARLTRNGNILLSVGGVHALRKALEALGVKIPTKCSVSTATKLSSDLHGLMKNPRKPLSKEELKRIKEAIGELVPFLERDYFCHLIDSKEPFLDLIREWNDDDSTNYWCIASIMSVANESLREAIIKNQQDLIDGLLSQELKKLEAGYR